MPSSQNERDKRAKEKREYRIVSVKLSTLGNEVADTINRLLSERKRAIGIRDSIAEGRTAFTEALEALKNDEDAIKKAKAAQDALTEEKLHSDRADRKSNTALQEATRRVQDAQEVQEKAMQALKAATEKVKGARSKAIRDIEGGFNVQYTGTLKDAGSEDNNLKNFYEDTYSVLKGRSVEDLKRSVSFWNQALDAQREICTVNEGGALPQFDNACYNLRNAVLAEDNAEQPNLENIKDASEEMKRIKDGVKTLKLTRAEAQRLKDAKKRLQAAFTGQSKLKGTVASPEKKKKR